VVTNEGFRNGAISLVLSLISLYRYTILNIFAEEIGFRMDIENILGRKTLFIIRVEKC
jgi:hypothetical protein